MEWNRRRLNQEPEGGNKGKNKAKEMGKRDYSSEKHAEATGKWSVYLNIELQIISL